MYKKVQIYANIRQIKFIVSDALGFKSRDGNKHTDVRLCIRRRLAKSTYQLHSSIQTQA